MKEKCLHLFTNRNMREGQFVICECNGFKSTEKKTKVPIKSNIIFSGGDSLADRWLGGGIIYSIAKKEDREVMIVHSLGAEIIIK